MFINSPVGHGENMKKKIPYGKSEFKDVKLGNYYYIDKTKYIPILETLPDYLFFIRPRRFGKSLFISMLHYYYDENYKHEFDKIFKDTWILKNKTQGANSYKILRFNFSDVDSNNYVESFNLSVNLVIDSFLKNYNLKLHTNIKNGTERLKVLINEAAHKGFKIFCLIDEYDNFANELMSKQKNEYKRLVFEQESIFKQFFKILKSATDMEGGPLKKMFVTGVSPMTMFDVTSGFNIGRFVSNFPNLHAMIGITTDELKELFEYYGLEPDIELLDKWYGNYTFSEDVEDKIYNTDMILYFLDTIIQTKRYPKEFADINIRADYGKLKWLVYTENGLNGNFNVLERLLNGDIIWTSKIKDAFSAFELIEEDNFISLLFYLGLVTIYKTKLKIGLKIVNHTIKEIICEYMQRILKESKLFKINIRKFEEKLADFALQGKLDVFEYLGERLKESTGIRDYIKGEQTVKMLYLVYLNLVPYYTVLSEPEMNKKFADIFLMPKHMDVNYFGLIELKYIPRKEPIQNISLPSIIDKAKKQLLEYEKDNMVLKWIHKNKNLIKIVLIYHGWEIIYCNKV